MLEPVMLEDFPGVLQAETNWCWLAATASIYNYFSARSTDRPGNEPQCVFLSDQIPPLPYSCRYAPEQRIPKDCLGHHCANPAAAEPDFLSKELDKYGLLECDIAMDGTTQRCGGRVVYGGFDMEEVRTSIDNKCPVGLRVSFSPYGPNPVSHFVIIIGYYALPADRMVIWDPAKGEVDVTLEELKNLYGQLQDRYLTQPPPPEKAKLRPSVALSDPASLDPGPQRDTHPFDHNKYRR